MNTLDDCTSEFIKAVAEIRKIIDAFGTGDVAHSGNTSNPSDEVYYAAGRWLESRGLALVQVNARGDFWVCDPTWEWEMEQ